MVLATDSFRFHRQPKIAVAALLAATLLGIVTPGSALAASPSNGNYPPLFDDAEGSGSDRL